MKGKPFFSLALFGSGSRGRFLSLVVILNLLLISIAFLSLQGEELETEVVVPQETRTIIEERLTTEEITHTNLVTIVVTPAPSPP